MSGRRSHIRFELMPACEGRLRVLRDVIVISAEEREAAVLSRDAGVVGEIVILETTAAPASRSHVTVVESRPVVVDGAVRHQLRLRPALP